MEYSVGAVTSRNRVVVVVSTIPYHMGMGSLTWLESVRGRLSTMIPTRGNAVKQCTICSLLVTMMEFEYDYDYDYDHSLIQGTEPRNDTLSVWR
jgi:hypothetical protein